MGFLNNLFAQPTPEEAEGYNVATTRQMVCFGMEGFTGNRVFRADFDVLHVFCYQRGRHYH